MSLRTQHDVEKIKMSITGHEYILYYITAWIHVQQTQIHKIPVKCAKISPINDRNDRVFFTEF